MVYKCATNEETRLILQTIKIAENILVPHNAKIRSASRFGIQIKEKRSPHIHETRQEIIITLKSSPSLKKYSVKTRLDTGYRERCEFL